MKADIVASGASAIESAQSQAISDQLGIAFDAGRAEGYASGVADEKAQPSPVVADPVSGEVSPAVDSTPFAQSDIDAAVAAAVAPLQAQAADLKSQLDAETALEGASEALVSQLRSVLSQIEALAAPAPAPAAAV